MKYAVITWWFDDELLLCASTHDTYEEAKAALFAIADAREEELVDDLSDPTEEELENCSYSILNSEDASFYFWEGLRGQVVAL